MCSLIVHSFKSFNFLLILMDLEFIILFLYICLVIYLVMNEFDLFFSMIFLVFSLCEGSLVLSVLWVVMLIRSHESDFMQFMNLLW